MLKKHRGFTLIELLVVIAIIGLLSTLSVVSLNNARARARDARRVSDVKQIQTALELYYNDVGIYPGGNPISTGSIANGTTVYMTSIPTAPTPADCTTAAYNSYTYTQRSSGASYTLSYCVGQTISGGPTGDTLTSATPAGIK